jgi:HJR/Mrr/RecB family endonuclease
MADWIVQANPKMYDVHAAVERSPTDWWRTPRYRRQIAVGDRIWLQIVGPRDPGIYYIASFASLPYERPDSDFGPWHSDIQYEYRIEPPLLRVESAADPVLGPFTPLRGFQGTMAPVPDEVVARLLQVTEGRRALLDGTAAPRDADVNAAITHHNLTVRQELKAAIRALSPTDFELLVVKLLGALGFEVEHTGQSGDGGVDADAVLSLSGLTSVLTRVQAKRWTHPVSSRTVRELRGALRVDERGLIVTTTEFTADAREEAEAAGKARIGLIGGEELVGLCVEYGIGVEERRVSLIELDLPTLTSLDDSPKPNG